MRYQKKHPRDTHWYFDAVYETVCTDYEDKYPERVKHPLYKRGEGRHDPLHKIGGIYFDFLPVTQREMLIFVLWKANIHVWTCVATRSKGTYTEDDVACEEDKDNAVAVNFKERFRVFGKDRAYYFVTQSGKLYWSPKPASRGTRKAASLWTDEKSPIRAVISDTASERTFVFTEPAKKDAKDGQRVYFELAEKIETKPYDRVPVDGLAQRLKTVMEYAQVLVKDKKIK
jgi:hypothetical protein